MLPAQAGLVIEAGRVESQTVWLDLAATEQAVQCPKCQQPTNKIQSHYQRKLADLNWANYTVRLSLKLRRFYCRNQQCTRRIFCERLEEITQTYARRTNRLTEQLVALALALGGRPAERLARKQGLAVSRFCFLSLLTKYPLTKQPTPRLLGVDDFALKRGRVYATLLVDLERRRPIEVLAGRTNQTLGEWLKAHPGIEVISRDRDSSYAKAAREHAPQAIQVADRFHILKNLRDYLEFYFTRKKVNQLTFTPKPIDTPTTAGVASSASLPTWQAQTLPPLARSSLKLATNPNPQEPKPTRIEQRKQEAYEKRLARYHTVKAKAAEGVSNREIAQEVGLDRNTVNRYVLASDAAEVLSRQTKPATSSLLDSYKVYLYQRFCEEQPTVAQLHTELREQGYTGSSGPIRAFLARLRPQPYWSATRKKERQKLLPNQIPPLTPAPKLSSREASWLIFKRDADTEQLSSTQRHLLAQLLEKEPEVGVIYELVQEFRQLVEAKRADELEAWVKRARATKIKELVSFCSGVIQDWSAVEAGLRLPYSNGQLEGQVNRVKTIKKQMYGRASFNLLRTRILAA